MVFVWCLCVFCAFSVCFRCGVSSEVFVWCLCGVCVFSVRFLCVFGVVFQVRCLCGVCVVFVWCTWGVRSVCAVFVVCLCGVCEVFVWCLCDVGNKIVALLSLNLMFMVTNVFP